MKFSSANGNTTTFIAEPYGYREYFDAGYIPSRTTTIYSEAAETPTTISYEARYTSSHPKASSIYAKTVTSAGLTVDLPSPDSGIGAESITPRDQNNIQQVMNFLLIILF
jgi:transcription factor CP2-like protein